MSFPRSIFKNARTAPTPFLLAAFAGGLGIYTFRRSLVGEAHAESPRTICPLQKNQQEQTRTAGMSRKGWGFTTLKLESAESVGPVFKKLRFQLPEGSSLATLPLTSAILTFSRPNGSFFPVIRPYTPITRPDDKGFIDLLVKKYPNGKASTHLHSLQPGDTLSVAGPIPGYAWKPNEQPHVNLVAGGAGITPMYQLIQGILGNADETTKIKLIYGANTESELVLRDELAALEKKFPDRFRAVYTVSDPATESSDTHKGRITKELLAAELARPGKVFVCGPPAMEQLLVGTKGLLWGKSGVLQELGYSKREIYKF